MSDSLFIIVVMVVAIGGLVGVAYLLERRSKKSRPIGPALPEPSRTGNILFWITRILVAGMVLSIIGFFIYKSQIFLWIAAGFIGLGLLNGLISRVVRLTGK